ncbi:hypothetical protein [Cupriavidus basilensis]|uniref:hypothetical protein n=1 Tax=Cupriavidus basilensis TaxID=68895 RepID=UPI003D33B83E
MEQITQTGECIKQAVGSTAWDLIVTGEGERAFCAGAGINEMKGRSLSAQRDGAEHGHAVFALLGRQLRRRPFQREDEHEPL